MNRKWMTAVAVVAFGATLAVAAPQEQGGWGHRHHRGGVMGQKFAEKLNLSDAQKQQIRDIKKASRTENAAFFQSARETWKEFREAKKANDTAKLDALKPALESNRAQMKAIRKAEMEKITGILTPAQQSTLQQLRAERAAKRAAKEQSK